MRANVSRADEALLTQLGPGRLHKALDQYDLWRSQDHVEIKQMLSDFATYLYLPRLRDRQLLIDAVRSATNQLVCDHFAYADGVEEGRYLGLVAAGSGGTVLDPSGLIVKPEAALAQIGKEPADGKDGVKPRPEAPGPSLPDAFTAA
jgi:hypothetical protein